MALQENGCKKDAQQNSVLVAKRRPADWPAQTGTAAETTEQQEKSPEWGWLKCDEEIESSASPPPPPENPQDEEEQETASQEDDPRYLYPHFNDSSPVYKTKHFEVPAGGCTDLPYPEVEYIRPNCFLNNFFTGHPRLMVESHFNRSLQNCRDTRLSNKPQALLEPHTTQPQPSCTSQLAHSTPVAPIPQLDPPPTSHALTEIPFVDPGIEQSGEAPPGTSLHVTELDHYIAMLPYLWQGYDQTLFGQTKLPVLKRTSHEPCSSDTEIQTRLRTPQLNTTETSVTSDEPTVNAPHKSTDMILDELLGICATPGEEVVCPFTSVVRNETKRQKIALPTLATKTAAETTFQTHVDAQLDAEVTNYTHVGVAKTLCSGAKESNRRLIANLEQGKQLNVSFGPRDFTCEVQPNTHSSFGISTTGVQTMHPWSSGIQTPCSSLTLPASDLHSSEIHAPHCVASVSETSSHVFTVMQSPQPSPSIKNVISPCATSKALSQGACKSGTQPLDSLSRSGTPSHHQGLLTPQHVRVCQTSDSSSPGYL